MRTTVGDKAFFTILKRWAKEHAGGNVTIPQFAALAGSVSGKDLDAFFQTWLYTPEKPASLGAAASSAAAAAAGATAGATPDEGSNAA